MQNSRKLIKHPISLALIAMLAVTSCAKKPKEEAAPAPTTSAAPASPSPTASASPTPTATTGATKTTTSPTTSAKPTLSAEAQKLGVKPKDETTCPENAPVKGNVTKKRGEIYFTTKYPDYKTVKPEICFKDVATAEKAGFRAPKAQ